MTEVFQRKGISKHQLYLCLQPLASLHILDLPAPTIMLIMGANSLISLSAPPHPSHTGIPC